MLAMERNFLWCLVVLAEAGAICLPNASLPEERKNLSNLVTGRSYSIGLWSNGAYPAAHLTSAMARILIEEVLNYHVILQGTSAATLDTFYAVMNCKTPLDGTNRRCNSDGTGDVHIALEVWIGGYQAEWDAIQKESPSTAPKTLGSMGYEGVTGMFVPAAVQQKAYNAEGINLDFYRDYNVSWRSPSTYFTSPGDLDVSRLLPCADTLNMKSNALMRNYVELTDDWLGVEQVQSTDGSSVLVAKCFDGYFWYSPACRADGSTCVTWLTGGSGWGFQDILAKATMYNMPLATAVAATWNDYATLPSDFDFMLYWWTPDPTFLRLQPQRIFFPAHDPEAWDKSDRRTESKDVQIDKIASRDLAALAPEVEEFLSRLKLSLRIINSLLVKQMDTGDSADDVACNWLLSNPETWTSWIPKRGKCYLQFGMYSEQDDTFLTARIAVTITCKVCPSGTYSSQLEDDEGITHICKPCAAGTFQPSGAAESCTPCPAGSFQDEAGSAGCNRCPVGEFQDQEGQRSCKPCPDGATTLLLGSDSFSDCGCKAGSISVGSTALDCIRCGEGMQCPFSSSLSSLKSGQPSSEQLVTQIQPGYFATASQPLKLFRCRPVERCPGGVPGACAGTSEGEPCAQCPEGKSWAGDDCAECGAMVVAWVIAGLLVFLGSAASYFFVNSPVTAQATPFKAVQMAGGLAVSSLQIIALLGLTSLKWPGSFQSVSSGVQVFVLDLDNLHAGCALGSGPLASYALGIAACPSLVAWMMLCYGITQIRWLQQYGVQRWKLPYTLNAVGLGLQLGFGTIAAVALKPMMCYQHPNGRYSVLSYPSVFCWEEGHGGMVACGIFLFALVVVGFPAACSYATWKLPYWSVTGKHAMVQCFRFCSANFQLNSYGFVLALLFRGLGFAVAIAAGTNLPPMQAALVSSVLVVYTVLQASIQPWKVKAINLADSVLNASLLLLTGTTLTSDMQMESDFAEYFAFLILLFVLATLCLLGLLCCVAFLVDFRGGDADVVLGLELWRRDRRQIAAALHLCASRLLEITEVDLCEKIQGSNGYDVQSILQMISVFEADLNVSLRGAYSSDRVGLAALNARLSLKVGDAGDQDAQDDQDAQVGQDAQHVDGFAQDCTDGEADGRLAVPQEVGNESNHVQPVSDIVLSGEQCTSVVVRTDL